MSTEDSNQKIIESLDDYQYGFADKDVSVFNTGKGLSEEIVRQISRIKEEPDWMTEFRVNAYHTFAKMPMPKWGVDMHDLDFNDYIYYIRPADKMRARSWDDVPDTIKNTFERLGIPEAERKFLAGVSTQYESEVVYHNMLDEVQSKGVIFLDMDSAVKYCPDLVKKYFATVVPPSDNKFAALNSCVWSGGSFIYVPPGVKLEKPLQSYFRINTERMGQFERTLIIADEGSDVHYVEGCTAPLYSKDSLHAAVVEIVVQEGAHARYTTIQNWSTNILNLTTQRARVAAHGMMEWVDGNIGSHYTMKYPCCVLEGEYARGQTITIAVATGIQIQDSGAKMIHLAPHTSSSIISKSVSRRGGEADFRDRVFMGPKADYSRAKVQCDTLILDEQSRSDTIPYNISQNNTSTIEHEAKVSKISEEKLFYLMSRGLSEAQATEMIVLGFLEPFTRELPMEYAVELNQLLKLDMSESVG